MSDTRFKREYKHSLESVKLPDNYKEEILYALESQSNTGFTQKKKPNNNLYVVSASLIAALLIIALGLAALLSPSLILFEKSISIRVRSATNLSEISGAKVVFVDSVGNILTDKIGNPITAFTDETGVALATIPYTENCNAQIEAEGFVPLISAAHDGNYYLSPVTDENTYRAVLTWNKECDLDAILTITDEQGTEKIHYFKSDIKDANGNTIAALDVDNETGDGPETITFNASKNQLIRFSVGSYSSLKHEDGLILSDSEAEVKLYRGDTLLETYRIENKDSQGNVWCVFEIKNSEVHLCNYTYSVGAISEIN